MRLMEEVMELCLETNRRKQDTISIHKCLPKPIGCGGDASSFKDELSEREYKISGWCQACQDKVFADPDEE